MPITEIVILTTAASEEEAIRIWRALVEQQLVACAQVLPRVRSIYRWEGKVTEDAETLVLLKTRQELFAEVAATIKMMHSYEVPEIIALPVLQGAESYVKWIHGVTRNPLE